MPRASVESCSYNHKGNLEAGASVVWLNDNPCPPQQFQRGPHSSQYAEIAAILITLQIAATHKIKDLLICTDPSYARLSFTCHIHGWKQNGFKTTNLSSIKISSKPATTLSRNTTCSSIGRSSTITHGNQGKTKTTVTKPMPLPKLARYMVIFGLLNPSHPAHLFLSSPATSMPEPCKTPPPPKSASHPKFPMMTSQR